MEDGRITIKFELDDFGNHYEASSALTIYDDLGMTVVDTIGMQLNTFLRQAGYYRENDYIFMESVTEDELGVLDDYLFQYRKKQKCANE